MQTTILLSIVFELLEKRRLTAAYLSQKHALSPRTVYRYVEKLAPFIPLHIKRGRGGGICLADNYRLPVGFMTETEYRSVSDALETAYAQTGEERFLSAKRKLSSQERQTPLSPLLTEIGEIVILPEPSESGFYDLLRILQESIREKRVLELLCEGEKTPRKTEPVSLLLRKSEWSLFAFCHTERIFRAFPLKSLRGARKTEENFYARPIPMYALNEKSETF